MANYPYIIAAFPDLPSDFERHPFNPQAVTDEVKARLSEDDRRLVDWLEYGLDGKNLSEHFYRGVRQTRCRFLIDWFDFDRKLRQAKVAYLEGQPLDEEFAEADKAQILFKIEDLVQREKLLDRLCWNKAAELVQFNIFDIDVILSLLLRLHIVTRWNKLDPADGRRLFRQLVEEVRGTFQGVNAEQLQ